jgi:hypothetical protein
MSFRKTQSAEIRNHAQDNPRRPGPWDTALGLCLSLTELITRNAHTGGGAGIQMTASFRQLAENDDLARS